jgi:hypothetical protein
LSRVDAVLPLHGDDFERFSLLRRTAHRFFRFEGRCLVMVPREHLRAAIELLAGDGRFVPVCELDVVPELEGSQVAGWWKQQALKLAGARLVESDVYLTLDADCMVVRPVHDHDFVKDGKAAVNYHPQRTHGVYYFASAALLRMPLPPCQVGVTPFVLSRSLVGALLDHLGARFGAPFAPFLDRPLKCTEYALYHVFGWSQGLWDQVHSASRTKLYGNSVWQREGWPDWDPARSFDAPEFPFTVIQSSTGITAQEIWRRIEPHVIRSGR